jgi:trehalose/maltose hydrolase-like predicted phosphorylase
MAFVKAANIALLSFIVLPASTLAAVSWSLTSSNFNQSSFEVQPYVANGYIGQRIPVEGTGFKEFTAINVTAMDGTSGWPLFDPRFTAAMVAGFYDQQPNTTGTNFVRCLRMRREGHTHFNARRKPEANNLFLLCRHGLRCI